MNNIVSVFKNSPALPDRTDGHLRMPSRDWFDDIAHQIAPSIHPVIPVCRKFGKALVRGKRPLPLSCDNGIQVSFDALYLKIMMTHQDGWSCVDFPILLESLLAARRALILTDIETSVKIKAWLNMIYGQLHNGLIQCGDLTPDSIAADGRHLMELMLSHDLALYCDTDECYFSCSNTEVLNSDIHEMLVDNGYDPHRFTYSLRSFDHMDIHRLKHLSIIW